MRCEICRKVAPLFGSRYCLWCLSGDGTVYCAMAGCPELGMEPGHLRKRPKVLVGRRTALCEGHHGEMQRLRLSPVAAYLAHKARIALLTQDLG